MEKHQSKKAVEWQEKVRQWKASGLSGYTWCKKNKVPYAKFGYWKLRILGPSHGGSKFVELPHARSEAFKLILESTGISLSLDHDFNEECLLRILRALRGE